MKKSLKWIFFVILAVLVIGGGVGGYWYYSAAKKAAQERRIKKADKAFYKAYKNYEASFWPYYEVISKMENKFEEMHKKTDASKGEEIPGALQQLINFMEEQKKEFQALPSDTAYRKEDKAVANLSAKAAALYGEEKKSTALRLVKNAREMFNLKNQLTRLYTDARKIEKNSTEGFLAFLEGEMSTEVYAGLLEKNNPRAEEIESKIKEKLDTIEIKGGNLDDEWAKLKSLLNLKK